MPITLPSMVSSIRSGTIVRSMSLAGTYWAQSVLLPDAAYIVRDDLIFTACHFDQDAHEDEYYTEHDEPTPEETRLLASLGLSIGIERGFMAQYPDVGSLRLDSRRCLDDPICISEIECALRTAIADFKYRPQNSPPSPPGSYSHFHWPLPRSVQREIYDGIDCQNHLLVRGLATWLKSSMLYMHPSFGEEANYPLWVSLDASLSIILDTLRANGRSDPTTVDAQNFIHDAFGEERSGLRYFEEFYEDRVMTMHPKSRFGTFAFAPIGHDDFYQLHDALRAIYRYIILGKVIDPQAEDDTEEFWTQLRGSPSKKW